MIRETENNQLTANCQQHIVFFVPLPSKYPCNEKNFLDPLYAAFVVCLLQQRCCQAVNLEREDECQDFGTHRNERARHR